MMKTHRYLLAVGPSIVLAVAFLIIPLVFTIIPSFFVPSFSLHFYTDFFADSFTRGIFFRSIRLSAITTLICIAVGLPTSYYISLMKEKKRKIIVSLIMFPLLTNAVVRGFAWISILGKNGIINQLFLNLHIIDSPLKMLYTDFAIVVGSVYLFLPVMISTLTSVMEGIGDDVVEAAYSLGSSPMHTFFKVIIPLSFSGLLVASVMVFSGTISAYTTPTLLGGNQNMMLASLLYQQSNTLSNWTNSAVIAFIMIVVSLGVMKLFNLMASRIDKRGADHV
ncbi:ABC transporter permease [Sphaerochaeta sp. PS]|uniref:ABC transporter permease n=1 Tax=Sphaerochaeta sp. PS TaxID=3076336 RepID=UPI0028A5581E|nr:ABC transporter permease [Sphaerochaeta sp. PS]MDT4761597.1 ABC transporter permease [Sphaerochaeta sp. PS]